MTERVARATPDLPPAPHTARLVGGKETSPELAALAAQYMQLDRGDFLHALTLIPSAALNTQYADIVLRDVRRLAASVLTQFEKANSK